MSENPAARICNEIDSVTFEISVLHKYFSLPKLPKQEQIAKKTLYILMD